MDLATAGNLMIAILLVVFAGFGLLIALTPPLPERTKRTPGEGYREACKNYPRLDNTR